MEENNQNNLQAFNAIVDALKNLDTETQKRTIRAVTTLLGFSEFTETKESSKVTQGVSFSENRDMKIKEFLRDKLPQTDVERVACLAYYLTHYKGVSQFKTIDLSTLNTEAAQPKFSNAAVAVANAIRSGFIVSAAKGSNQLSAAGEVFVQALPDREAARANVAGMRIKKRNKKSYSKNSSKD